MILIVDDHPDTCGFLIRLLGQRGHAATSAGSGEAALAALAEVRPSLIVLDYMMPGMSGLDVLRRIRSDAALAAIPVVIYSAAAHDGELRAEALRLGAADWVPKADPRGWEVILKLAGQVAGPATGKRD